MTEIELITASASQRKAKRHQLFSIMSQIVDAAERGDFEVSGTEALEVSEETIKGLQELGYVVEARNKRWAVSWVETTRQV